MSQGCDSKVLNFRLTLTRGFTYLKPNFDCLIVFPRDIFIKEESVAHSNAVEGKYTTFFLENVSPFHVDGEYFPSVHNPCFGSMPNRYCGLVRLGLINVPIQVNEGVEDAIHPCKCDEKALLIELHNYSTPGHGVVVNDVVSVADVVLSKEDTTSRRGHLL